MTWILHPNVLVTHINHKILSMLSTNITQITCMLPCYYHERLKQKVKSTFFQDIKALPVKSAFPLLFLFTVIFIAFFFVY